MAAVGAICNSAYDAFSGDTVMGVTLSERTVGALAGITILLWISGGLVAGAKCGLNSIAGVPSPLFLKLWALSLAVPGTVALVARMLRIIDP